MTRGVPSLQKLIHPDQAIRRLVDYREFLPLVCLGEFQVNLTKHFGQSVIERRNATVFGCRFILEERDAGYLTALLQPFYYNVVNRFGTNEHTASPSKLGQSLENESFLYIVRRNQLTELKIIDGYISLRFWKSDAAFIPWTECARRDTS